MRGEESLRDVQQSGKVGFRCGSWKKRGPWTKRIIALYSRVYLFPCPGVLINVHSLKTVLQPPEIRAEIGKPATLSCKFNYSEDRKIYVAFSKTRDQTKSDINGTQNTTCSPLASMERLFLCETYFNTNNIRLEDEGVYYCKVGIATPGKVLTGTGNGTKLSLYGLKKFSAVLTNMYISGRWRKIRNICCILLYFAEV
uniref:Ig-like domain-containing protein n=1 Tax=Scleropages formosus TaxID=113540 RepID=A0A8C9REV6_SCLFO